MGRSTEQISETTSREVRYNLDDETTAEARRLARKITGRKVTGELVINLNQGGVSAVRVREVINQTK